jgi:hypothetical protein
LKLIISYSAIDRATGKPYQERKRGFKTAKEAHEARIKAMKKVHDMGGMTHANMSFEQFIDDIYLPDYLSRVSIILNRYKIYKLISSAEKVFEYI